MPLNSTGISAFTSTSQQHFITLPAADPHRLCIHPPVRPTVPEIRFPMSTDRSPEIPPATEQPDYPDHLGWAGMVFAIITALLYTVLRQMLIQLPTTRAELSELSTNAPVLSRLMIVAASASLSNIVALILSMISYVSERRSHTLAVSGIALSAAMLLGFFSIVFVSLLFP